MTLGERIRAVRKERGWTQKQLSERCGIAEPTIRSYESGRLNPKVETLQKITDALEYPLARMMQMDNEETVYTFETFDANDFFKNFSDSSDIAELFERGMKRAEGTTIRISKTELANLVMKNINSIFINDAESSEFLKILSELSRDEALQMLDYGRFLLFKREGY
jgi:transcriptional regulator with XRE-family HTH domain